MNIPTPSKRFLGVNVCKERPSSFANPLFIFLTRNRYDKTVSINVNSVATEDAASKLGIILTAYRKLKTTLVNNRKTSPRNKNIILLSTLLFIEVLVLKVRSFFVFFFEFKVYLFEDKALFLLFFDVNFE